MFCQPHLPASPPSTRAEPPVCAEVALAVDWMPQVVRSCGIFWFTRLLRFVSVSRQVPIAEARCCLVPDDGQVGRDADIHFTSIVLAGPHDGVGRDVRL